MADALYTRLAATASKLLAKYGDQVILRNYPPTPAYDPATGTASASPAPNDTYRNGALFDFGEGQAFGPGGVIQQGDKKLILEPGDPVSVEDHVIVQGLEYVIKGVAQSNPAGEPVAYTLHLRR